MDKKVTILAITASLVITTLPIVSPAQTAGAPFSGTYLGIDAGPAWASSNYQTNPNCPLSTVNAVFCNAVSSSSLVNGTVVANSGSGQFSSERFNYDAHIGHNWNVKNFLFGGEAELGGLNLNQSKTAHGLFPYTFLGNSYSLYDSISTHWLATLRARAGIVMKEHYLLYATGGLAFTDLQLSSSYSDNAVGFGFPGGSGSANESSIRTGWTLGGGGEWQLNDAYSIKLEYLYVKFNSMDIAVPLSNTPDYTQVMQASANLKTQILRLGFNYRF